MNYTREQDAEDAKKWRDHVAKLDALVAFCPTCCQGFTSKGDLTRDETIYECGKAAGKAIAGRAKPCD